MLKFVTVILCALTALKLTHVVEVAANAGPGKFYNFINCGFTC